MAAFLRASNSNNLRRLVKPAWLSYSSYSCAKGPSISDFRTINSNNLRRLVKPARPSYSSYSCAKGPSISDLPHSSLGKGWTLVKAAVVSNFTVSTMTFSVIWMGIQKGVDVQSVLEKLHLPRPDRPYFNSHTEDHESDNSASFGNKKNRTAELAASKAASPLALALLINKSLFPLRAPFAVGLICPVAKLLASNSKALVQVKLLPITINVDGLLVALSLLWIRKKPDLKEESGSEGGAVSLEIIARQVLTKVLKELENWVKKDKGSGASQLVAKDLKEESASSLEIACQTKVSCNRKDGGMEFRVCPSHDGAESN